MPLAPMTIMPKTVRTTPKWFFIFAIVVCGGAAAAPAPGSPGEEVSRTDLHGMWRTESSCVDKSAGQAISTSGFTDRPWHKAEIPGTVVGALVTDKTLPDPNYAIDLKSIPGADIGGEEPFSNRDMPANSPYRCSFWFRTEFESPKNSSGRESWLHFLGINYRANIWLNGKKIADRGDVVGAYRSYEFRVRELLKKSGQNALAVEVFAPEKNDLGLTWVDWNPTPPDKDMGIWREVYLTTTGEVALRAPFVNPKLDPEYKTAALSASAELRNTADHAVRAVLRADIGGAVISQSVDLGAGEAKIVRFTPEQFSRLKLAHPKLWWPYQMGEPYLYTAKFSVEVGKEISDRATIHFGVREVKSELTPSGGRLFQVNGKRVLIRGAAWAPDMMLRWSSKKLDADLAYTKDMGLNTIRLEGKVDREEFFEKTDRLGILIMPGWICCDAWEHWNDWTPETHKVAAASMVDQITRLRNHPSVFVWLYGSDGPPPADVEQTYLDILKKLEWPNPAVSSASATPTKLTGNSGVKMTGPYEYVPPIYWLADKQAGGAYGYNTETSPGPAIPPKESLAKFIPKEHLWPIDEYWNFHAGGERFTTVNVFTDALTKRYGAATSLDDYLRKAQAQAYDNQRSMFEAYARNKYVSTGVIQWMLNNAWPSLIWHLYDYYLVPAGGYFGTKKADEIIHVQYSYDENSVAVVNGTYEPLKGVKVLAKLYNLDSKEAGSKDAVLDLPPDAASKAFDLPTPEGLSTTYFLKLTLHDTSGKLLSDNFYWLSTKADTMDWANKQDTVYTPQKEFGDLTGLQTLPQVKLKVSAAHQREVEHIRESEDGSIRVKVKNTSGSVAFQVHPRLTRGKDGDDVVPIFWEDNYFSLLPGEEKTVTVRFAESDLEGKEPVLEIDGFNIAAQTVKISLEPAGPKKAN
jgi:exo-1,4-beta-D-glucosaminidase